MQAAAALRADNKPIVAVVRTLPYVWVFRLVLLGGLAAGFALGGPVGKSIAVCAALFALLGDCDGAIRHIARMFNLLIAIIAAPFGVAMFAPMLAAQFGWGSLLASVVAGAGTGLIVLIVLGIFARLVTRGVRKSTHLNSINRFTGAAIGAAEGALLVATFCWAFSSLEPAIAKLSQRAAEVAPNQTAWIPEKIDQLRDTMKTDPAAQWLTAHNPVGEIDAVSTTRDVAMLLSDPVASKKVAEDPRIKSLFDEPAIKRHAAAFDADAAMRESMQQRDISKLIASPQFAAMVNDPELIQTIMAHWADVRAALADAAATSK